jgi:hypothetical protein
MKMKQNAVRKTEGRERTDEEQSGLATFWGDVPGWIVG